MYNVEKKVQDLKRPDKVLHKNPKSVQQLIDISKISVDGVFQLSRYKYSKSYYLEDANYDPLSENEQLLFFSNWCDIINSIDVPFKITFFNKIRNMNQLRKKILYQYKNDGLDSAREAFNNIIEAKLNDGTNGIEQMRILTICVERKTFGEARTYFASIENNLFKLLAGIGSAIIPLNADQRLELLYNFYRIGDEEKYNINTEEGIVTGRDWKNDIACSFVDFKESDEYFVTDRKYCKSLYFNPDTYPSSMKDDLFLSLTKINHPGIFTIDFVPLTKGLSKKLLSKKSIGIESDISRQQTKHNNQKNFSSEISYQYRENKRAVEEMMDDVDKRDQKLIWTGINIVLMEDTLSELAETESDVQVMLDAEGIRLETYKQRQREGLNTALPIGVRQTDAMRLMLTRSCGAIFPFCVKEILMSDGAFYYGVNQISRNLIMINRKKLINGSGFVFGIPGSGKSFTGAKMEMASVRLLTDDDIIIIDPMLEYFDVAKAFGGIGIDISADGEKRYYINPLDVDQKVFQDQKELKKIIQSKSQLLMGICCQVMDKDWKSSYYSVVDWAVKQLYISISQLPEEKQYIPIMSDFKAVLLKAQNEKKEAGQKIALSMERFIDGSLDIFNHQTNIDMDNRICVYGCQDLSEELNISMSIMLDAITKKVRKNWAEGKTTWIYCDEFQVFLENSYTAKYFIKLYREIRKMKGIPTALSQNISVVLNDTKTATLVSNSEYVMFLKQSGKDAKVILDNFECISEGMMERLINARPGTGLIRLGNDVIIMDNEIEKTNPIYDIFNTNPYEKAALSRALKEKGKLKG